MNDFAVLNWTESGKTQTARWRAESGLPAPQKVIIADDQLTADAAFRLASDGTGLLWRGDFQNARQLLQALARRADRKPRVGSEKPFTSLAEAFHHRRTLQARRAQILGMLLLPFEADHKIPLRRAPNVRQACVEAYGDSDEPYVASLRELLGLIGAHEWRKKGVAVPAIDDRIYAHYGVFSPVRSEYVGLVAETPLPSKTLAFDIGTGTGVLAAVLAKRGVARVVATDLDTRALACAQENITRLKFSEQIEIVQADLFPEGRAPLIVCNPPWVPAQPSSPLERGIFDPDSRMLRGFITGLAAHLEPNGEGWLILSDLAEHLGLRTRAELLAAFDAAALKVAGKIDVRPNHPRVADDSDPLHAARAAEVTSLWRLVQR